MSKKKQRKQKRRPNLVYSDTDGNIYDAPELEMAVRAGNRFYRPATEDVVPLPEGSRLFTMPSRMALGWDNEVGKFVTVRKGCAVAAFPPPGYTRLFLPAAEPRENHSMLPLWAYTAVGWMNEQFWIAATQVDENLFWNPASFDDRELVPLVERKLAEHPENRLWEHLSRCAIDYHCFAAKNAFYGRWECPLPTSPGCNSRCVGCLSLQPRDSFEASHERITFVPTVQEIVEVALPHVLEVEDAIVSFGQGCEGDPILQVGVIAEALQQIRGKTDRGTLNMNTNASRPESVERLAVAGLNSIRVSLNSATEQFYDLYYRPANYSFADVTESIRVAKAHGLFVSVNLLMYPGLSDLPSEIDALVKLIGDTGIDMIQMRNLSIDPDVYARAVQLGTEPSLGMRTWMEQVRSAHPHIQFGYFNRPKSRF